MWLRKVLFALVIVGAAFPSLAAPDHYSIDPTHTFPSIEFSHMGISVWRGKFNKTSGKVILDRVAKSGAVEVEIDAASIHFGLAAMGEKARSEDFFHTEKFPIATCTGTLKCFGEKPGIVDGQITIMGVNTPTDPQN